MNIKFKAKRCDNNEWVYGYLVARPAKSGQRFYIITIPRNDDEDPFEVRVHYGTICQFMGVSDIDGKDLYKDDKVEYNCIGKYHDSNGFTGVLTYLSGRCCFAVECSDGMTHYFGVATFPKMMKVVGNIYDKQELASTPNPH